MEERNQPLVGIYTCVYCVCTHTERLFTAHTHIRMCVCVWYSSKSARTGHVSFSQTLSTETERFISHKRSQLFELFLSSSIISVCVVVCVRLPISIYNLVEYIHIYTAALPSSSQIEFIASIFNLISFRIFSVVRVPVKIKNGALVNFKSPNPIQRWKKRRKRQSAISSAKLMKVVPSSLSIPVHLFSPY
jgi:hypothetical protein